MLSDDEERPDDVDTRRAPIEKDEEAEGVRT